MPPPPHQVCYGLRGISTKNVEEEWTVVDRDPEDEICAPPTQPPIALARPP